MYPKEYYTKVKDDLDALRMRHRRELDERRRQIYCKLPRVQTIEQELQSLYQTLGLRVLESGEDPQKLIRGIEETTLRLQKEKRELLIGAGFPEDSLQLKADCLACKDTGVIGTAFCSCFQRRLSEYAAQDSNLSAILDTQNFEYFDFSYYSTAVDRAKGFSPRKNIKNVFRICVRFVSDFDKSDESLFMFGPTGLGKTFLSSCIAKDLLDRGKSVFYQSAPKIFKMMEDHKFGRGNTELLALAINKIYQSDLLIIDDLGTEMATVFSASALFDIINTRLFDHKKTIINTNIDNNQLVQLYSDRVVSRIIGHYTQLEFFGNDIRLAKKALNHTENLR